MPISDYTMEDIERAISQQRGKLVEAEKGKDDVDARLKTLLRQMSELKANIELCERHIGWLREAKVLLTPVPQGVWELRIKLVETRVKAQSDDITVRQAGEFRADAVRLEKELIEACHHPLIVNAKGYEGYHNDEDDRSEPGERFCTLCDKHEYEYARYGGEGGFKLLVEAGNRLFRHGTREKIAEMRGVFRQTQTWNEILDAFTDNRLIKLLESSRQPTP